MVAKFMQLVNDVLKSQHKNAIYTLFMECFSKAFFYMFQMFRQHAKGNFSNVWKMINGLLMFVLPRKKLKKLSIFIT